MSSFYGNSGGSSGSGEGTTNYNDLSNKPITNKTGTTSSPIIFSDLSYGTYNVVGQYAYTSMDDESRRFANSTSISIYQDIETGNKVAIFEVINNDKYYIYKITFDNDDNYTEEIIELPQIFDGDSSSDIYFMNELPSEGAEDTLYIVGDTIYRWMNNKYISLSGGSATIEWGEY